MPQLLGETTRLLHRMGDGDDQARSRLISHAKDRLFHLSRQMLRSFPGVQRWEQTDDVHQCAMIRLHGALANVNLESSRHFWNLATQQIRRVLLDLARHYQGPEGLGSNHFTDGAGKAADDHGGPIQIRADERTDEPESLQEWTVFHQAVEALPEEERELFGLLWYQGLTQEETASVLAVSLRTVKRRWQSARLLLSQALAGK